MALSKQNVGFAFSRGVNQKTSEMTQPVEDLRQAENVVITKTGELNPRNGFHEEAWAELGGAAQPGELFGAAHHQDELVVFDGEKAYSRYASGKFKDRGTCVNVQMRQESVDVNSASMDGAPAYSTIKVGSDNDLYEIFVWESRPFGVEDDESNIKSFLNASDTHNYRNKPSRLLYSIRHKATGVLLYDAVPISIPSLGGTLLTKDFVDRDLIISKAAATDYGVSRGTPAPEEDKLRVFGYGSDSTHGSTRSWADVAEDGNQLILEGPFNDTVGAYSNAKASIFFVDDAAYGVDTDYAIVEKLSSSSLDRTSSVLDRSDTAMAHVSAYLNVETGKNAMYFTTQPMLFSMTDNVVVLTFASQYAYQTNSSDFVAGAEGYWSIFQATFDFSSAVSAIGTVSLLSDFANGRLDLNYKYPIWDADLAYTTEDDHGIAYVYYTNDSTNTTKLQYYKYNSTNKNLDTTPVASTNVPRADGSTATQLISALPMEGVPGGSEKEAYMCFGGTGPDKWPIKAVPSRFVLKCINHTDTGNPENHANNKIVFVFSSDATKDDDIYVYTAPSLSDSTFGSWSASLIKPLLDRATSSSQWNIPDDLALTRNHLGAATTRQVPYDSGDDKFSCAALVVANAAITNVKSITGDAIYLFVEVASKAADGSNTWQTTTDAGSSNRYICSEDRWIIRKNLANSSDTKVLGRNINILSDAWYPYSGSKAYFVGHSVFAGDPSTARTCLFNEDGETVGTYAPGQAVLCHPYEMQQITIPVTEYSNTPLFALRSRLNYHRTDAIIQPYKYANQPSLSDYPMPAFGISVIEHAERAYQYMAPFNPRIGVADFFPPRPYPSANINGTLFTGSGLLWAFNGGKFVENGFLQKPLIKSVAVGSSSFTSGGVAVKGINQGDYTIAAAYFWKDDMGVTHYSGLDFFGDGGTNRIVPVRSGGKKLVIQIANTAITNKRSAPTQSIGYESSSSGASVDIEDIADMDPSSVSVAIFASVSLSEVVEEAEEMLNISLRLIKMQPLSTNARMAIIEIDTPNKSLQFKDAATDASALVYNHPVQPSCPTDITEHKNHVCVSTVDGYVYPSQSFTSSIGTEGSSVCPVFAAGHTINIGEETNGVGASNIESDGQTLMAFNKDAVYSMAGDGPDFLNSEGGFAPPEVLYLDQGVAVGGATARIPAGVVYQSTHGLYLLRGKNLSYLGAPLDGSWGTANTVGSISGVSVLDETSEIVFAMGTSGDQTRDPFDYLPQYKANIFVYNYEVNQWYTWALARDNDQLISGCSYIKRSDGKRDLFLTDNKGSVRLYVSDNSSRASAWYDHADYSLSKDGGAGYYRVQINVKTGKIQFPQFLSGCRVYRVAIPFTPIPGQYNAFSISYVSEFGTYSSTQELTYTQSSNSEKEVVIKPQQQKVDRFYVDIACRATANGSRPAALNGLGLLIAPRQTKAVYNVEKTQVAT